MKLLKKYKWIVLGFFILIAIFLIWIGKDLFLAQEGALYGNRLEGKKDIPIDEKLKRNVSDLLLSKEGVTKVSTNVHGIIFSVVILVDETIAVDKAKEMANEALTKLSDEQLAFYDISLLVDYGSESSKTDFPIIGYKNKNSETIVW